MSMLTWAVLGSLVGLIVSAAAAFWKAKLINEQSKAENIKSITVKIGDETISLQAPEHEARVVVEKLQQRSGAKIATP